MSIEDLINDIDNLVITDADGDLCRVKWNPGVLPLELKAYEKKLGFPLPDAYRQFLLHADGCNLFGLDIQSHRAGCIIGRNLLPFHNWGNGDFDCLHLDPDSPDAPVLFMNHGPDVTVKVADSFEDWLAAMVEELQREGTVYHPGDYRSYHGFGLYDHVLNELKDVDCELNR